MQNFRTNFRNGNDDISCQLGCGKVDSQEHLLNCEIIKAMSPELVVSTYLYNDLFSTDVSKIKKIVTLLNQAMKVRDGIMEK